jgi:hypothetical protein
MNIYNIDTNTSIFTEQIIYWQENELSDNNVGADFNLSEETLLYVGTQNTKLKSGVGSSSDNSDGRPTENGHLEERGATHNPLNSPPNQNKPRVITLTPGPPKKVSQNGGNVVAPTEPDYQTLIEEEERQEAEIRDAMERARILEEQYIAERSPVKSKAVSFERESVEPESANSVPRHTIATSPTRRLKETKSAHDLPRPQDSPSFIVNTPTQQSFPPSPSSYPASPAEDVRSPAIAVVRKHSPNKNPLARSPPRARQTPTKSPPKGLPTPTSSFSNSNRMEVSPRLSSPRRSRHFSDKSPVHTTRYASPMRSPRRSTEDEPSYVESPREEIQQHHLHQHQQYQQQPQFHHQQQPEIQRDTDVSQDRSVIERVERVHHFNDSRIAPDINTSRLSRTFNDIPSYSEPSFSSNVNTTTTNNNTMIWNSSDMRDEYNMDAETIRFKRELEYKYQEQLREEKNKLMRLWSNEKREILRKANEDREVLMIENSRLRKELNTSYSSYSIEEIDSERRDLRRKLQTLDKQNMDLQSKLFQTQQQNDYLKDEFESEKRKWALENQHSQEERRKLSLQIRTEQDRANDMKQNQIFMKEKSRWEEEKQITINNWREEVEILTVIAKQERDNWHKEKLELVSRMETDKLSSLRDRESQIGSLSNNLDYAYTEIDQLRDQNQKLQRYIKESGEEYEKNKLLAQSADYTIRDLKTHITQLMRNPNDAELLTETVKQKAIEQKLAERLTQENLLLRERFHEEMRKRKYLHNILEDMKGNIRVIIRLRPLLDGEKRGDSSLGRVEIKDEQTVSIYSSNLGAKSYEFFRALGDNATQEDAFDEVRPLIQSAIDGYNVCILAYGQTGSGKTFTIHGDDRGDHVGVLPRAVEYLFTLLRKYNYSSQEYGGTGSGGNKGNTFAVKCSMVELYLDTINDLLDGRQNENPLARKLDMRQHQSGYMYIPGVSEHTVNSPDRLLELLDYGTQRRQVHPTEMNLRSSRSHTIFTIYLTTSFNKGDGVVTSSSKLLFVDLAGSENISKSHSEGDRFKEATQINKSLSALGDVIAALSSRKTHIPYRNSKLTQLLQDSIGGNSKTVMFANISPSASNIRETNSTLNFSSRVKHVQNQNIKNLQISAI